MVKVRGRKGAEPPPRFLAPPHLSVQPLHFTAS